jgi:hypothetical protein
MEPQSTTFPGWKTSLRSAVLMALLAGVTGLAWALTIPAGRTQRQAAALLAEVRQRGLDHYWAQAGEVRQWYLIHIDNNLAGWELHYRQPTSDGYVGGMISWRYHTRPRLHIQSHWLLSSDARTGRYRSTVQQADPRQPGRRNLLQQTEIRLSNARIDVTQITPKGAFQSARAVPDHYIPEGTRSLMARLIAEKQAHGTFKMVLDDHTPPPGSTTTPLITVDYDFEGTTNTPQGETNVSEKLSIPGKGSTENLLTLDASGRIVESRSETYRLVAATQEAVVSQFPQARRVLENLSAE